MTRKKSTAQQLLFQDADEAARPNDTNDSNSRSSPPQLIVAENADSAQDIAFQEPVGLQNGDLVVIVDSHSLIYQVFHAMPTMTAPDGTDVAAVHGFLRDLAELRRRYDPAYLLCAFDESEVTFRNELYPEYKAHREPMPAALHAQVKTIRKSLQTLAIPVLSQPGFEADDILATLTSQAEAAGASVILVTSDKDCRQLLSENTSMLNIRKGTLFGPAELIEVWNIRPDQVVDFQAMCGDSVDNVPGVPKIGPKAAADLLAQFDSLDGVYENVDSISANARRKTLQDHRDQAYLSRDLVRLDRNMAMATDWIAWRRPMANATELEQLFQQLGFRQLATRYMDQASTSIAASNQPEMPKIDTTQYRCIDSNLKLVELVAEIRESLDKLPEQERWLSIDTETTSTAPTSATLVGIAMAWNDATPVYVPVRAPQEFKSRTLALRFVIEQLGPLLADATLRKIGQNLKYDLIVFANHGFDVANVAFDTMLADYLCSPGDRNHSLDELSKRNLGHEMIPIKELIGSGKTQITIDAVDLDRVTQYAAEDTDVALRLVPILQQRLTIMQIDSVFYDLEMPLVSVLVEMERNGIQIDPDRLQRLSGQFEQKIAGLRDQIFEYANDKLNLDSPKQLANLLFERLNLRVVKRTKSGPSTDVEVLQELALEHPLPALIIEYRQASKLKSTYIDALPKLINPITGRVHTSFRQDVAATGRLSSTEPNLQNIPIRTEEGRSIRSAFIVPGPEWIFLAADYSQIELRMMAHFCNDETLTKAFLNDEDIHTAVAAQVYGCELQIVSPEQRRSAKAINFGILYGQSPFGLAKALNIDKGAAAEFIDAYFANFSGVRAFMLSTLAQARRDGYVATMSGRRRYLNGIRDFSKLNPNQQKTLLEPERMAVNTIIQGSAADLIKVAMIALHRRLSSSKLKAKMLLQIHDELLFEVHRDDAEELHAIVKHEMTHAAQLSVPLIVDIKTGPTWADL